MHISPAKKRTLIAIVSLVLGLGGVLFISDLFFVDHSSDGAIPIDSTQSQNEVFYSGIITYISPSLYPEDEITFALTDENGKRIILLKAKDEMLTVSEDLNTKVYGRVLKTKDGKDKVLLVERVVINNAAN